jgi:hypothetical protein
MQLAGAKNVIDNYGNQLSHNTYYQHKKAFLFTKKQEGFFRDSFSQ